MRRRATVDGAHRRSRTADVYDRDPRRPRNDGPPRPPIPALLHPRAPATTPGSRDEELQTYRNALDEARQQPVVGLEDREPGRRSTRERTVFRIDLRWYVWDATIWNRILQEYPYGVLDDTDRGAGRDGRHAREGAGRPRRLVRRHRVARPALLRRAATPREPHRSRRSSSASMPSQNIQQERVARVGFNGSRHLAVQPRPRTARLGPRHVLADLRLRRAAREPRATALNGNLVPDRAQRLRVPARARAGWPRTRSSTPAARPSSRCPTACTRTTSSTPTTSGSTRGRSPSSATRSGPTARSKRACRACRATSPASCRRPIR